MHRFLISAAALCVLTAPALAQPDDPGQIRGKGGFGQYQQRQAEQAQHGGPTSFTDQVTGQPPGQNQGQNQGQQRGDRGDGRRGQQAQQPAAQQPAAQPQAAAPQQGQGRDRDRANGQDRDNNRGNWQGGNGSDNRAGYDNRGYDRGNRQGGYDNRRDNRYGDRGGSRRDFSRYSNYHRDWRPTQRYRAPSYRRPAGWYARRWTFGEYLPSLFWARDYWLDYRTYDLPPPPYGAVWVRVGDDALMIDQDSGEVITVSYNVFY